MLNYTFDSEDEKIFYQWLLELYDNKIVKRIEPDRISFSISDKVEYDSFKKSGKKYVSVKKTLINEKVYTPDFIFELDNAYAAQLGVERKEKPLLPLIISNNGMCYVDVKGAFTRNLTSSITFPDRQAMMYQKHQIYINKVIPYGKKNCLFKDTFYPRSFISDQIYKVGDKKGTSKLSGDVKTIDSFLKI